MTDHNMIPPQAEMGGQGFGRHTRGKAVVKPKDMGGTLRRLWTLTDGHRKGLGWIISLSALSCVSSILSPLVIGKAVTCIDNREPAVTIILILIALYLGDWLIRFLQQFFMAAIGQRIILGIRTVLFDAMSKKTLAFFDHHQHGELMSRLTNDVDNISNTISNSLTLLLSYIFTILGILGIMIYLSPLLTAVSLAGVFLIYLLTRTITGHTGKLFAAQQKELGKLNGQVEESISGMNVVKAFCREEEMLQEFEKYNSSYCRTATTALIWSGFLMPIMNVINNLSFVAISVVSGMMAVSGIISIGMISTFLLYVRQFGRPFVEIANIYNNFQTAVAGAERVFEIIDEPAEPEDAACALPLVHPAGKIELQDVSFGYDQKALILKNVSLRIEAGTKVAIVGPTGAGKTTIINLLTRFYDVTGGKILLDGNDIRAYRMKDLRNAFGVVLQDTSLFTESISDNIGYGKENVTLEEVKDAAKTAGADAFIRRLPHGYQTILTQGGAELSQGERQLLTIARAILSEAPILILDEATSSVDTVTEQKIRHAMLRMTTGRTSFIIAHRLSTIRDSDWIILIENGGIAEQGTHNWLMEQNGRYARMYRTQLGEEM